MINEILNFIISFKELLAIALSPAIAIVIGEWLRTHNYKKQQRDDLVRRLLSYGYQMSPTYISNKGEILRALNEIKYWYSDDISIKESLFTVWDKMADNQDAQDEFIALIQEVGQKEGHNLSREDVEKVFSTR